jgi:hypothetical protein
MHVNHCPSLFTLPSFPSSNLRPRHNAIDFLQHHYNRTSNYSYHPPHPHTQHIRRTLVGYRPNSPFNLPPNILLELTLYIPSWIILM